MKLISAHKTATQETFNVLLANWKYLQIVLEYDHIYTKKWSFGVNGYNPETNKEVSFSTSFKFNKSQAKQKAIEYIKTL